MSDKYNSSTVVNAGLIPEAMRKLPQWVVWRYETGGANNKPTKVLYIASEAKAGRLIHAKTNDETTWGTLDDAMEAYRTNPSIVGIGYCFSSMDNTFGADLDYCFAEDKTLLSWAQEIVDEFGQTYMEISPSGSGLHILGLGRAVRCGRTVISRERGVEEAVEIYDSKRYFTVTGDKFLTGSFAEMQPQLDWLHVRFFSRGGQADQTAYKGPTADFNEVKRALDYVDAHEYETWLHVGMALKAAGFDRTVWDEWSKTSTKFDPGANAKKWDSFRGKGITLGTLFHLALENGFRFSQNAGTGHLDIARETLNMYGSDNLICCQSSLHKWDGRVWVACDDKEVNKRIIEVFESMNLGNKVTGSSIPSVLSVLKSLVFKPDDLFFSQKVRTICVLNGELFFNGEGFDLRPHERENYRQSMLPVSYDPKAVASRFEKFLEEVFADDPDQDNKIKCTKQFLGYSLTTDCRFERYPILNGPGRNGKSVLISVVGDLVGEHNKAAVDPGQFDNKFQRSYLRGKLVNIVTEISEGHKLNDGSLKALVSGEPITAEEKHKNPFTFRPYAKLWFATNHLPYTRDTSRAFFARAIILEFNQLFQDDRCDPLLSKKLEAELPGILNLALTGLASLYAEGKFTEPASSVIAKDGWWHDADHVALFVAECCERGGDYQSTVAEIYEAYRNWTYDSGIKQICTKNSFSRRLKAFGVTNKNGTGGTKLFRGIQLSGGDSNALAKKLDARFQLKGSVRSMKACS